jgi:hypothetical protein
MKNLILFEDWYTDIVDEKEHFNLQDLVRYKDSDDDTIYQIYRIHTDTNELGYQTGYMRNIKTKFPKWEMFCKVRHLTDLEKNAVKYNL